MFGLITKAVPWIIKTVGGKILGNVVEKFKNVPVAGEIVTDVLQEITKGVSEDPEVLKLIQEAEAKYRDFVLSYEGKAENLPPAILTIRACVRPVITFAFMFVLLYMFIRGHSVPPLFEKMSLVIIIWWFASRTLSKITNGKIEL